MEKINKLKIKFKKEKIDGYLISKNDEFFNEYIPKHNDRLKYVSNFSGSYGFALLLKKNNYLFKCTIIWCIFFYFFLLILNKS